MQDRLYWIVLDDFQYGSGRTMPHFLQVLAEFVFQ
jgi:hypothetical protein